MNTFFSLIAILSLFGGIFYFAWKSDDMGVNWSFMLLGIFQFRAPSSGASAVLRLQDCAGWRGCGIGDDLGIERCDFGGEGGHQFLRRQHDSDWAEGFSLATQGTRHPNHGLCGDSRFASGLFLRQWREASLRKLGVTIRYRVKAWL